jgi:hypothetical protein
MVQDSSRSGYRLFGVQLFVARAIWGVITLLIFTMLVLALPLEYAARLSEGTNLYADSLSKLNLLPTFYAGFRTFMDLSLALIFFVIAVVLFFRKPSSRIVILSSIATQTFGALFVPSLYFLVVARPAWYLPVSFIRALGLATSLIVYFYMIPDGRFRPRWTRWFALIWLGMVAIWFLFPSAPGNLIHMSTWTRTLAIGFVIYILAYGSGIIARM